LPSCDVLGYGRDVVFAPVLSRGGGIHHFDITLSILFFVSFSSFIYILQVEFRERCPDQRY
jgi:hypothetical protein